MEKLYRIPEGAQDFMESPLIIRRGADVVLRYDYEQEDGRYGYKGILFHNCTEATHHTESEIKYTDYRQAYNSVASDGGCFYIFFDGFGLYSFQAESFEQMATFVSCEGDVPECFLHDIDRVYHLTELEYQQSDKRKTQLVQIMKELRSMRGALDRHVFAPYYPRVITDEWPRYDALGHELLQLARDYMNLR